VELHNSQRYPLKQCPMNIYISIFIIKKTDYFQLLQFLNNLVTRTFIVSTAGKHIEIIRNKLNLEKRIYLPHYWTNKGFKGTVVNRAFPESFEITLIQSLKRWTFEGKYFSNNFNLWKQIFLIGESVPYIPYSRGKEGYHIHFCLDKCLKVSVMKLTI